MLKSVLQDTRLLFLLTLAVLVKVFSLFPAAVERYYTYGFYPVVAKVLRLLLGWLPFSLGDVLYFCAAVYLLFQVVRFIRSLPAKGFSKLYFTAVFSRLVQGALVVYVLFNILWGLNYNRQGIAYQLGLHLERYSKAEVAQLTTVLQQRLNFYAARVDTLKRKELDTNSVVFQKGFAAYGQAAQTLPFLSYSALCIKPSLYTYVGHYFGFTGYYNPFSGEAQIKTTVPVFLKPFVTTHEMAHQLGYARENEANFVAFLSCRQSPDVDFRYSMYYELYRYALRELYNRDSTLALSYKQNLHPLVRQDNETLKEYFLRTENKIEPLISSFYDQYLKMNQQKKGLRTYNEVVALLIAYQKKYGWDAI